jgi:hypothetical protein
MKKKLNTALLRLTNGNCSAACLAAPGSTKHQSAQAPLWCFIPPQFVRGSLLRKALLPAKTVSYLERCRQGCGSAYFNEIKKETIFNF